ncbi:MAG: hypothetical protein A2736_00035 [Candidatus Yanofskybacteria bacterium RIFCSPHIGHO2_01_FULL_41_27]|uniref:Chaperone protein DnaJ n=3 Tax=Parcubacteria group TaxID=1794811 RepID=A0A1F8HWT5_9BACT|nr:MAG: Chaperone protein DnaJ [Candidatus Jorgensenbacteria bacterium GW2011_GWF2_41_8]KKT16782.1 MAG: Chaperone protein DnaJ [Parcubacteria group bacterium GW2011_GWB1_43_6]OGM99429.1 MAG: hypothetical protein A2736_00035 [Candidatus Yanofskybacteria bacterium RIFCSPHIGHO2_01_FULL_41_27]OGN20875.1 MAG: hypothetical protein A3B00_01795 [Candidatus Yanofskybacteria bacterium RIFCSPLOWO2_01_FULL_41_33]OGN41386.1 MAG: hypothetical protein A2606_01270 [Candidatus Yanofskybacteria bacterium RIFOXYD
MAKDFYTILGVPRTALPDEIKRAYRKMAHEHHPDKKTGNEEKFKEINEAYQVLSDPKKRSNYDNFGFAYNDGGFQGGYDFGQGQGNFWDVFGGRGGRSGSADDIFDIFSEMFGGYSRQPQYEENKKGEDIVLEVRIGRGDLGSTRAVEFDVLASCEGCGGNGVAKGYRMSDCKTCGGAGQVKQTSQSGFGFFSRISVCRACSGKGKIPEKLCGKCSGFGRMKTKRKIEIRIPEDLENNYSIVVPKGGNMDKTGKSTGDLVIVFKLK